MAPWLIIILVVYGCGCLMALIWSGINYALWDERIAEYTRAEAARRVLTFWAWPLWAMVAIAQVIAVSKSDQEEER